MKARDANLTTYPFLNLTAQGNEQIADLIDTLIQYLNNLTLFLTRRHKESTGQHIL